MNRGKHIQNTCVALLLTVGCMIIDSIRPVYSSDIDNYVMSLVANHRFAGASQDIYDCHIHPLMCMLIEVVHRLLPDADAFLLVAQILLLLGIGWGSFHILEQMETKAFKWIYVLCVIGLVLSSDLLRNNFTVWTGFFCMVGILTLMTNRRNTRCASIMGIFFLIIGTLWRWDAAVLFAPFVLLHVLTQVLIAFFSKDATRIKQIMLRCVIPVITVGAVWCSKAVVDSVPKYQDQMAYDRARSDFLDYPKASWQEIETEVMGISENDYSLLSKWILLDTDFADTETFQILSGKANRAAYELNIQNIFVMQKRVVGVILESPILIMICVLLCALFFYFVSAKEPFWHKLELLFAYLGADIILMYFVYKGRAIERVYIVTLMAALMIAGALLLNCEKTSDRCRLSVISISIGGVSVIFTIWGILNLNVTLGQSVFYVNDTVNVEEDNLYIWDASLWVNEYANAFMKWGKLIPENDLQCNLIAGAWIYHQVFFEDYLDAIDINNPMYALIESDSVFYIAEECTQVYQYLCEHTQQSIEVEQIGKKNGIPVWEFRYE